MTLTDLRPLIIAMTMEQILADIVLNIEGIMHALCIPHHFAGWKTKLSCFLDEKVISSETG